MLRFLSPLEAISVPALVQSEPAYDASAVDNTVCLCLLAIQSAPDPNYLCLQRWRSYLTEVLNGRAGGPGQHLTLWAVPHISLLPLFKQTSRPSSCCWPLLKLATDCYIFTTRQNDDSCIIPCLKFTPEASGRPSCPSRTFSTTCQDPTLCRLVTFITQGWSVHMPDNFTLYYSVKGKLSFWNHKVWSAASAL